MKTSLLFLLCITGFSSIAQTTLQTIIFSSGFDSPVAIANCGDTRLFVVERQGKIIVVDTAGIKSATPFLDIDSIVNDGNDEREPRHDANHDEQYDGSIKGRQQHDDEHV